MSIMDGGDIRDAHAHTGLVPSPPLEHGRHSRRVPSSCQSLASFSPYLVSTTSLPNRPMQHPPGSFCWHTTSCACTGVSAPFMSITDSNGTTGWFCSYNIREEDEDVIRLAMNRSISVTAGVVWAGIVSRYWWPTEARRELSRALGE